MSWPRLAPASRVARIRSWVAAALLAAYLVNILVVTLTPTPVDRPYRGSLVSFMAELHARGVPEWIGYPQIEFAGNVLFFVPAGFLAVLVLLRRGLWWVVAVLAPVFSAMLEGAQAVFLPERQASVLDVVANGVGGAAGAVLAMGLLALVERPAWRAPGGRRAREEPSTRG